jgi:hypothetical protein
VTNIPFILSSCTLQVYFTTYVESAASAKPGFLSWNGLIQRSCGRVRKLDRIVDETSHCAEPPGQRNWCPCCSQGNAENCAVVRRVAGRDEESARRILKRRPLVQANLLRKFSISIEQTLIVLPCAGSGATEIDERAPPNR